MTEEMKKFLNRTLDFIENDEWKHIYKNCFECTWKTTWNNLKDGKTYVITGDIEAMWLRDSSLQVLPYFCVIQDDVVRNGIKGLIKKQAEFILMDPYANAFNRKGDYSCYSKDKTKMGPWIWERKYEVDSLAFPCFLLEKYYEATLDNSIFTEDVVNAIKIILHTWTIEQEHATKSSYSFERESDLITETLQNQGKGTEVSYTGMTWSGFRPSDDACTYHYLIPSNMLAVTVLEKMKKLPLSKTIIERALQLAAEIKNGIYQYGIVRHAKYGEIFAYETNGKGDYNLMDDANMPSLLSAPWFGFCDKTDPIYENTRRFLLSKDNPYFFTGEKAKGIGSPHTPSGYVWHIALAVQGLTAETQEEKLEILRTMMDTSANTGHMHESFDPNSPEQFTRPWFAWADSMFCLLTLDYLKGEL